MNIIQWFKYFEMYQQIWICDVDYFPSPPMSPFCTDTILLHSDCCYSYDLICSSSCKIVGETIRPLPHWVWYRPVGGRRTGCSPNGNKHTMRCNKQFTCIAIPRGRINGHLILCSAIILYMEKGPDKNYERIIKLNMAGVL